MSRTKRHVRQSSESNGVSVNFDTVGKSPFAALPLSSFDQNHTKMGAVLEFANSVHELRSPQRDENGLCWETNTGEVVIRWWYCESAQQLDPEPQENQKMSPPRGEHAREYSSTARFTVSIRGESDERSVRWKLSTSGVQGWMFTRK